MALTDPELDLLREMLEEDPADEVFLQVGEELVRRGDHAGAAEVDLVGHSQGGSVSRYYANLIGGDAKVGTVVGIANFA